MRRALERLGSRHPKRRVFITGAASGLGFELARCFAGAGWSVGLFDLDKRRLAQASRELADRAVLAMPGDATDHASVDAALSAFTKLHGTPDILINSAGIAAGGDFSRMRMEDFVRVLATNFLGPVNFCSAVLPRMRRRGSGHLVNVSSAAAFVSAPGMSVYNCSKAALLSLSETLAAELAEQNIRVSVAMPGFFATPLLQKMRGPRDAREAARKLMASSRYTVEEAARDIVRGMARGSLHIVAPGPYRLLWRLKRLWPAAFTRRMAGMRAKRGSPPGGG